MQAFGYNIRLVRVIADRRTDCRDDYLLVDNAGRDELVVDFDKDEVRVVTENNQIVLKFEMLCGEISAQYALVNLTGEAKQYVIDYGEKRLNVGRVHYGDNAL